MAIHFHPLTVSRVTPEAAGSAAITFAVPADLRSVFDFQPGQFLTLRAQIAGVEIRRSYSICSPHQRYRTDGEIDIGIKPVAGGVFSRWALAQLRPGSAIDTMPPDGRFTSRRPDARHRVAFAAGSGITPGLSIVASTLAAQPDATFTLVYGNQRADTIMFNEALQDLKDRYPARLALVHLLSRQAQEVELLNGRIDEAKVGDLLRTMLPPPSIDEVFLCGPEGMITAAQRALLAAGVAAGRIHTERFFTESTAPAGRGVGRQDTPAGDECRRQGAGRGPGGRAGPALLLPRRRLLHLPRPRAGGHGGNGEELHTGALGGGEGLRPDLPVATPERPGGGELRRALKLGHQTPADFDRGRALVHGVEVQAGHAAGAQLFAQAGHHVQAEGLDRGAVVAIALQLQPDPARDLGAARIGKPHQLGGAHDGH